VGEETEMGSTEDLVDCHEYGQEILHCQLGNDQRSLRHLEDCQEGSGSMLDCQVGSGSVLNCQVGRDENLGPSEGLIKSSIQQGVLMKMGSVDLIVCQESSGSILYCQEGRDEQMRPSEGLMNSEASWIQPGELMEQMSSRFDCDQRVQLTAEEDQRSRMMIGGIPIFLPSAQEEAENCVANGAAAEQSQLEMTVKRKLEQTLKSAQAEMKEETEHSEEWLKAFSIEAEETATWEFAAGAEEENEHSEEWLDIFSRETENTAARELAAADEEHTDNICFADLWDQFEALEERVRVQGMHIQQEKLELMKKKAWEIMMIFPMAKNFCS
jgi:hypothetical protein